MKVIGITGGIGSGKSIVSRIVNSMGYPVFNSDEEAKNLLMKSAEIHLKLKSEFGEMIFTDDKPDRKKIATLVFNSEEKLLKLNLIIHPAVKSAFSEWKKRQESQIVFREAAILIESGSYSDCDKIILVSAPEKIRTERVMKRDLVSEEQVRARMKNQWNEEKLKEFSDYIILNDGNQPLLPQINRILSEL